MYLSIYLFTHIHICKCIYIYICRCMYIYTCIYICIYISIYIDCLICDFLISLTVLYPRLPFILDCLDSKSDLQCRVLALEKVVHQVSVHHLAQVRQPRPDSGLGLSYFPGRPFQLSPIRSTANWTCRAAFWRLRRSCSESTSTMGFLLIKIRGSSLQNASKYPV